MIDDQSGRILVVESMLADAQRALTAHDLLLRALLTHLALGDAEAFASLRNALERSEAYRNQGLSGAVTQDVADVLSAMLEDVIQGAAVR